MKKLMAGIALATALAGSSVQAATIDWTDWSTNSSGSISGGIAVTFSGEMDGLVTNASSYNPGVTNYTPFTCCSTTWYPDATFADGSVVANAPPTAYNAVELVGSATVNTIAFSQSVKNPVISIWSLGNGGDPASFTFNLTPTLVVSGDTPINDRDSDSGTLTVAGFVVSGTEGNGTIQFIGDFDSISFTSGNEFYYAFTTGIAGPSNIGSTPLPPAWILLVSGFTGLGFFSRRGKKNSMAAAAA